MTFLTIVVTSVENIIDFSQLIEEVFKEFSSVFNKDRVKVSLYPKNGRITKIHSS